jgi:hypothetical protein
MMLVWTTACGPTEPGTPRSQTTPPDEGPTASYELDLLGTGGQRLSRILLRLPATITDGELRGSWLVQPIPGGAAAGAPVETRAMRALGESNALRGTCRADELFLNLRPDVVDNNVELVLRISGNGLVGKWQYATDAGIEATGNANGARLSD